MSKVEEYGKFRIRFDERGEPVEAEYGGRRYEVEAGTIIIPLSEVAGLKLRELPRNPPIEPYEAIQGAFRTPISYSPSMYCHVAILPDKACVQAIADEDIWQPPPPCPQYVEALRDLVKKLEAAGAVETARAWDDDSMHSTYFEAPAHPDKTVGEVVETLKKAIRSLEEAAKLKALGQSYTRALEEAEKHLRQLAARQ